MEGVKRLILDKVIFNDSLNSMEFKDIKGKYLFLIPAYISVQPLFFLSLIRLVNMMNKVGVDYKIALEVGTYLPYARETLSKCSFLEQCDYLVWLDSDISFQENALLYLMLEIQKTKYDMISPVLYTRMEPKTPLVYRDTSPVQIPKDQEWIDADVVGFGCLLMKKTTLEKIHRPHFDTFLNDKQRLVGEDFFFFRKAKEYGLTLGVNTFLRFGHIGGIVWND